MFVFISHSEHCARYGVGAPCCSPWIGYVFREFRISVTDSHLLDGPTISQRYANLCRSLAGFRCQRDVGAVLVDYDGYVVGVPVKVARYAEDGDRTGLGATPRVCHDIGADAERFVNLHTADGQRQTAAGSADGDDSRIPRDACVEDHVIEVEVADFTEVLGDDALSFRVKPGVTRTIQSL